MDVCDGAAGPRPLDGRFTPGTTVGATVDDVNGGYCGVQITTPGIWWYIMGTGKKIRASSCDTQGRTQIKVKISVFTGSCSNLRCVGGGSEPDYECTVLTTAANGDWNTSSTAFDFDTFAGQTYYILVQQMDANLAGNVWMSFREPNTPQNNDCINAIGPVPRDNTLVDGTTVDGSTDVVPAGFCDGSELYPGVWYQIIGTGGSVTIGACAQLNTDGFHFSVYDGANCNSLTCVSGTFEKKDDPQKCTFTTALLDRPFSTYTFNTRLLDRYYILVSYAATGNDHVTSDFRFYVDDGANGLAGADGSNVIKFAPHDPSITADGSSSGNNGNGGKGSGASQGENSLIALIVSMTMTVMTISSLLGLA